MFIGFNSPFYTEIVKCGLATTYCPNIGYNCLLKHGSFTIGFQGIKKEDIPKVDKAIQDVLKRI